MDLHGVEDSLLSSKLNVKADQTTWRCKIWDINRVTALIPLGYVGPGFYKNKMQKNSSAQLEQKCQNKIIISYLREFSKHSYYQPTKLMQNFQEECTLIY